MNKKVTRLLTLAVVAAFSVCAFSQALPRNSPPKPADLKLTIIPDKKAFVLHEKVYTRIEFRNLGSKTFCFPKPSRDCTNDFPGSAVTTGRPVMNSDGIEQFVCHYDTGGPHSANLESEIRHHWIRLAPNDVYLTDRAEAQVNPNALGEWRLETTYWQPQSAFNPAFMEKRVAGIAEDTGCMMPMAPVVSEPVTIHVVSLTDKE